MSLTAKYCFFPMYSECITATQMTVFCQALFFPFFCECTAVLHTAAPVRRKKTFSSSLRVGWENGSGKTTVWSLKNTLFVSGKVIWVLWSIRSRRVGFWWRYPGWLFAARIILKMSSAIRMFLLYLRSQTFFFLFLKKLCQAWLTQKSLIRQGKKHKSNWTI